MGAFLSVLRVCFLKTERPKSPPAVVYCDLLRRTALEKVMEEEFELPIIIAEKSLETIEQEALEKRRKDAQELVKVGRKAIEEQTSTTVIPADIEKLWANGIWHEVFGYLKNPEDVKSASKSCSQFNSVIQKMPGASATLALRQALQIMNREGYLKFKLGGTNQMQQKRAITKLRMVSKSWRNVIDQEYIVLREFFSTPDWHLNCDFHNMAGLRFRNATDVTRFMGHFNMTHIAPPIPAVLYVEQIRFDHPRASIEQFYVKITEFLQKYGEYILAFVFFPERACIMSPADSYETLGNWVKLMPNLKALGLLGDDEVSYDSNPGVLPPETEEILVNRIKQIPFPVIPTLKCFYYEYFCHPFPCPIVEEISKQNAVTNKIGILGKFATRALIESMRTTSLESLNISLNYVGRFKIIARGSSWPLRSISCKLPRQVLTVSEFSSLFMPYKDTLETLYVKFHDAMENDGTYLELPHLRTLHLLNFNAKNKISNIDFLLKLKSLQDLTIKLDRFQDNHIGFMRSAINLWTTWAWMWFSELREINLRTTNNTRNVIYVRQENQIIRKS